MKKSLLLFAAVVVSVSFCLFAFAKNETNLPAANLYWYKVVGTAIDHTQPVNNGTAISKTALLANPSLLPCPVGPNADCVRGFMAPQTTNVSAGQTDSIKKP